MISNIISVFGGSGFIGSTFIKSMGNKDIYQQSRDDLVPKTNNILWFISTTDNYNVFTNPALDIYTNQMLLIEMLASAKNKFGNDFIVNFISSWFVYGEHNGSVVTEDSECYPRGFYSITKYAAEQLLISYCETFGCKYRILRLANVIGHGDKRASPKKNAIQWMIYELCQGHTVSLYTPSSIRDVIDVRDCVGAIDLVIVSSPENEIYNIGNGDDVKVNLLIEIAKDYTHSGSIINREAPTFHKNVQTREFRMSNDKIVNLGYHRLYSLATSLNDIIDGYRNAK